jgi:phage terminase small subunit
MARAKRKTADDRRARFAQEYPKDLNATQAAIRAGYSANGAKVTGSRLLSDANVRAQIDASLKRLTKRNEITVERTLREIARVAYSDVRQLFDVDGNFKPLHELDDDAAAQIAGIELEEHREEGDQDAPAQLTVTRKVKRWDKGKALSQCMAYLGMHKTAEPGETGGLHLTIEYSGKKARS